MSVLLLSGGVDSMVLLTQECYNRQPPRLCITFNYGQQHAREVDAAQNIAAMYRIPWQQLWLPPKILAGSSLTGSGKIPQGLHYTDPKQAATVVPNRNLLFLSIAASFAVRLGTTEVLFAAHKDDAAVYQDCRPQFVEAASAAMLLACGVRIRAPFLDMTKKQIVQLGKTFNPPYGAPFGLTWSCYLGGNTPCNQCGACIERNEAFLD